MESKKQTIEYIASVEHLDKALTVVSIKGWLFLLFSILLGVSVLVWSFVGTIPITIDGKAALLTTEGQSFKIYGFFSMLEGARIQPGMEVKIAFNTIKTSQYGMMKGVVKEVDLFPVSVNDPAMMEIPSESLREYLVAGKMPNLLVAIDPTRDPKTVSGFAWTSQEGPPIQVEAGMIGTAKVNLEQIKPISLVIPTIGNR